MSYAIAFAVEKRWVYTEYVLEMYDPWFIDLNDILLGCKTQRICQVAVDTSFTVEKGNLS